VTTFYKPLLNDDNSQLASAVLIAENKIDF